MPPTTFPTKPLAVEGIGVDEVLELLDRIDGTLPSKRLVEVPEIKDGRAIVIGDTHGDWPTLQSLAEKYLIGEGRVERFVLLGDYVDRSPEGLPFASIINAIYVLSLMANYPDRVLLFRGNHEAFELIPFQGHDLMGDSLGCWDTKAVSERIEAIFDKLPLGGITENGIYLAHAGYPITGSWRDDLLHPTNKTWLQVLWNDVDASPTCGCRGIDQESIGSKNLNDFLFASGARVFVRGHDPAVAGELLYHNRVLTVHTTRDRASSGVLAAQLPLGERLNELSKDHILKVEIPPLPPTQPERLFP
jgi:hypothetical protein